MTAGYSILDIKTAILNYSDILKSDQHYFEYKWTITEFLIRCFYKFVDWKTADVNYKNKNLKLQGTNNCPRCGSKDIEVYPTGKIKKCLACNYNPLTSPELKQN